MTSPLNRRLWPILAVAAALAWSATPAAAADSARGRAVAQAHCARCHAIGVAGKSPNPLSPPFRDLGARFPVADLIGAVGQGASTGHPKMPRFRLKTAQALDLVAYVASVQTRGAPSAAAARVLAGRRIAADNCGGCHAVAGGTSPALAAPPFTVLYKRYGPGGVRAALEEGMIADNPKPLEEGAAPMHPAMPRIRLDQDEIAALTAYLESLDPVSGR